MAHVESATNQQRAQTARPRAHGGLTELTEVEHLYRTAPIGLCLVDPQLRYVRINDRLAAINGKSVEEHLGRTVWEIVPGVAPGVAPALTQVFATGEPVERMEVRGTRSAEPGIEKWWRVCIHPVTDKHAVIIAASIAVEDITEQKEKEAMLVERLRFEQLLADLSAMFVNVSTTSVHEAIGIGLRRVREFLGVDRSTFGLFFESDRQLRAIQSCAGEGISEFPRIVIDGELPWYFGQVRRGHIIVLNHLPNDLPEEAAREREVVCRDGIKSNLSIPLRVGGAIVGGIAFDSFSRYYAWPEELVSRMWLLGEIFANAVVHERADNAIHEAIAEIEKLKNRLERENVYLRQQITLKHHNGRIIGQSDAIRKTLADAERVAGTQAAVLLLGETGTGKELVAQTIHELSPRKDLAMLMVNCASLTASLIESELFGREAGAYTGALSKQMGRFEVADGSTLFLDEIGELPFDLQAKLLRVLENGRFERVGSPETIQVDVRIIAATNRNLEQALREGRFREDLYHRLNVFPICVPPLRQRCQDIPLLVWAFVEEFNKRMGKKVDTIPRKTLERLQQYSWPGNVRELRNVIERAMILTTGPTLQVEVPLITHDGSGSRATLDEVQRRHILQVLRDTGWRIRGANGAAAVLGLKPTTLECRMARLGIRRGSGADSGIS